jgi:hypothetical protein
VLEVGIKKYNSCGTQFTLQHALPCKKGGLICDIIGDLAAMVWKDICHEPVVKEDCNAENTSALIVDIGYSNLRG